MSSCLWRKKWSFQFTYSLLCVRFTLLVFGWKTSFYLLCTIQMIKHTHTHICIRKKSVNLFHTRLVIVVWYYEMWQMISSELKKKKILYRLRMLKMVWISLEISCVLYLIYSKYTNTHKYLSWEVIKKIRTLDFTWFNWTLCLISFLLF